MHGLATDFLRMLNEAITEVLCGQTAGFIQNVDQNVRSVCRETLAADRVVKKGLGENSCLSLEFLRISQGNPRATGIVYGDVLDFFRTHNGTAAAAAMASDVTVRILDRDIGCCHLELTSRTDCENADLLAHFLADCIEQRIITFTKILGIFLDSGAIFVDVDA